MIGGDGVGPEVIAQGIRVLEAACGEECSLDWEHLPWGSEHHARTGAMMPADGLRRLEQHDAVYLGAVGSPGVPDHVTLWGLLLPIRQRFDLYLNIRPIRLLPGVATPLAGRSAGRHRHGVRAREHRGRVRRRRRARARRHGPRGRPAGGRLHARRRRARRPPRVRARAVAARPAREHHQVEREPAPFRHVGRDRRRRARRLRRRRARPDPGRRRLRLHGHAAAAVRRDGRVQPVRRHHHRHRRRHPGRDGARRERERLARRHRPRPVRAGARLGARHRRPLAGEPRRRGLGRRDDARPPRRGRGRPRG